jgi:N utilization substance protein A
MILVELDGKGLGYFTQFESVTRVMPSDYLETAGWLLFLVEGAHLGKAIGKKGANVRKLADMFRKKVVVIGDSNDIETFVRNFFNNVDIVSIELVDIMGEKNIVMTVAENDRGIAIGKEGERIKAAKEFLKRKFNATIVLRTKRSMDSGYGVESHGVEAVAEAPMEQAAKIEVRKEEKKDEGESKEGKSEKESEAGKEKSESKEN